MKKRWKISNGARSNEVMNTRVWTLVKVRLDGKREIDLILTFWLKAIETRGNVYLKITRETKGNGSWKKW